MNCYFINKKIFDKTSTIVCEKILENYEDEMVVYAQRDLKEKEIDYYIYKGDILPDYLCVSDNGVDMEACYNKKSNIQEYGSNLIKSNLTPEYSDEKINGTVFYIDAEASKDGSNVVVTTSKRKISNYKDIYKNSVIEFVGDHIPEFLNIDYDTMTARNFTRKELIDKGLGKLDEDEIIIGEKIVRLKSGQYYDGEHVKSKPLPEKYIPYRWDFKACEWVLDVTSAQAINMLIDQMKDCNADILALKQIGLDSTKEEEKMEYLKSLHLKYSEEFCSKINQNNQQNQSN